MNNDFLERACAINCALIEHVHPAELVAAKELLRVNPQLSEDNVFAAAVCGNEATVRRFVENDPEAAVRRGGPRNWTPLLYLCFSRFLRDNDPARIDSLLRTAKFLLAYGAEPNAFFMLGDERETALYAACGVNNNARLARLLLEAGAEVNDEDATYHVAEFDDPECVGILFEHGLDADCRATVLLRKLDFEDLDGVRFILDHGGDVNHPGRWGMAPLHQTIMRGRSVECIQLLVDRGADANAACHDGATPWYLAWLHGRPDVADFLKVCGCDTALPPKHELVVACSRGDRVAVRKLLDAHPGLIKSLSRDEQAAIIAAARSGNRVGLEAMLVSLMS